MCYFNRVILFYKIKLSTLLSYSKQIFLNWLLNSIKRKIVLFCQCIILESSTLSLCLTIYIKIIDVGAAQMKGIRQCLPFIKHPFQEQKQMSQPERKVSKLQASVKLSCCWLMWGNDGSCALRKAQTMLSNGMFSEENPVHSLWAQLRIKCFTIRGVDCSHRGCQAAISIVNNWKKTFMSDVENCFAFSGSGPQPSMVFHYN